MASRLDPPNGLGLGWPVERDKGFGRNRSWTFLHEGRSEEGESGVETSPYGRLSDVERDVGRQIGKEKKRGRGEVKIKIKSKRQLWLHQAELETNSVGIH